jgi:hypothetical protein
MLATQIEISSGKSLQQGINDGTLAKVDGGWSAWSACVNDYQTRTCNNLSPFCGGANCAGSNTQFCGTYLVNNIHTQNDCTNAGGSVYSYYPACAPGYSCPQVLLAINFCKFPGSSCSGKGDGTWQQYGNWSTTSRTTSPPLRTDFITCYLAWTNSHNFASATIESCEYHRNGGQFLTNCNYAKTSLNTCSSTPMSASPTYIYATRTEIGCY